MEQLVKSGRLPVESSNQLKMLLLMKHKHLQDPSRNSHNLWNLIKQSASGTESADSTNIARPLTGWKSSFSL